MTQLLHALNGKIITPTRYAQFVLVCKKLDITPMPGVIDKNSPWLAGFFDADGCVTVNRDRTVSLSITQKDDSVLKPLVPL